MDEHRVPPIQRLPEPVGMPVWLRFLVLMAGMVLAALFGIASLLKPSATGTGTHVQIPGLPPCGFLLMTGVPCPSCGMTTSWAYFVRGEWLSSVDANAGGFTLALVCVPSCVWFLASGIAGRWMWIRPGLPMVIVVSAMIFGTAMIQWLFRQGFVV